MSYITTDNWEGHPFPSLKKRQTEMVPFLIETPNGKINLWVLVGNLETDQRTKALRCSDYKISYIDKMKRAKIKILDIPTYKKP